MYENVIYNRNMFYRDKLYDYKKFCERIALVKPNCNPKSPPEYPFLRTRLKKKEMENEKKKKLKIAKTYYTKNINTCIRTITNTIHQI